MPPGTLSFRGETTGPIFDPILHKTPAAPVRLNPDLPSELERIIFKCLEKDRDLRYQHAADIRADLKRLRRDLDSGRTSTTSTDTTAATVAATVALPAYSHSSLKKSIAISAA